MNNLVRLLGCWLAWLAMVGLAWADNPLRQEEKAYFAREAGALISKEAGGGGPISITEVSEIGSWPKKPFFFKKEIPSKKGTIAIRNEGAFLVIWIHHQVPIAYDKNDPHKKIIEKMTSGFLSSYSQMTEKNTYSDTSKEDMEFLKKLDNDYGAGRTKITESLFLLANVVVKEDGMLWCEFCRAPPDNKYLSSFLVVTHQDVFIAFEHMIVRRGKPVACQGLEAADLGKAECLIAKDIKMPRPFANACTWPVGQEASATDPTAVPKTAPSMPGKDNLPPGNPTGTPQNAAPPASGKGGP
jgi:hypothetical protein